MEEQSRVHSQFVLLGALGGGLSVLGGAFGAHILKSRLADRAFEIFELAIRYQMYHSLALCLVGLALFVLVARGLPVPRVLVVSGFLFLLGILLFSGSLYAYSLADLRFAVRITPFGGVAWLVAWTCMGVGAFRLRGAAS